MATPRPRLVLASGSPRRQALLREAGYQFDVVPPDPQAECGVCSTAGPEELVRTLALRKAADVVPRLLADGNAEGEVVLLAADTVAECQGQILGKPDDEAHARSMLQLLRGRTHRVHTGICLWELRRPPAQNDPPHVEAVTTTLWMTNLSDDQMDQYLATGAWEGKAGGFGLQDQLGWIQIHQGSESNVVGLPLERVTQLLAERRVFTRQHR